MARMVNSWNEWDPLKRVIVGRPEGTQVPAVEPGWQHDYPKFGFPLGTYGKFPQEMVDAANEQMDNFVSILEKRGIVVDRVEVHPALMDVRAFSTPDWTQLNFRGANNPRDLFLPVGNEIMEGPCSIRARYYEYLCLRPLFERYFKEDPEFLWTSAPRPRLTDEDYEQNYYYNFNHVWSTGEKQERAKDWRFQLTEKEPLWDAADASRCGKDIFWQASCVTDGLGEGYWLHPWHIDGELIAVRPGLVMVNPDAHILTEEAVQLFKMNDWEMIPAARPMHYYEDSVNVVGHPIEGVNWISMNTFSLGPNTICVEAHEEGYMEQLDKLGFEVVPVPYDHVMAFGGELHCTTLDVYREGTLEDYFPKQIPGF
jgi:glycine amidinotransferase